MAITTLDGIIAGMRPPEPIYKTGAAKEAVGLPHTEFYSAGRPGAAVAPTPGVNGAALTTYAGQIPWVNPGAGNSYLARFTMTASAVGSVFLVDRLWHNSGLSLTSTSLQSITPVAIPARDRDGTTNGEGILAAFEYSAAGGAGTPTATLTYTNQAGTTGKTTTFVGVASPNAGSFFQWPLAAGDTGVRAVTGFQLSATWTSGTAHIVLYRILATIEIASNNSGGAVDAVTGGFPRLYDNTVPFFIVVPGVTTATTYNGSLTVTQG